MQTGRANLRIPRRAIEQWERVKKKLAAQIEARGQEADGPTIFCEACAVLDAATGGTGIVEEPTPKIRPFAKLLPPQDPGRVREDRLDLAAVLRAIADRLEAGEDATKGRGDPIRPAPKAAAAADDGAD